VTPPPRKNSSPHSLTRRLATGAAWAFFLQAAGSASTIGVNAILARLLSTAEFGSYLLLQSIVVFAAMVARLGLKQTVVRFVAESMSRNQPGRAGHALRIVYWLVTIGALVIGGAYAGLLGAWLASDVFYMPILGTVIGTTTLWIIILAYQTPVAETFRGLHEIRLAVLLDGVLASTLAFIALALIWTSFEQIAFSHAVQLMTGSAGLSLILGTLLLRKSTRQLSGRGSTSFREVISVSSPIFVANLATQAMTNFSLWIVGALFLAQDVALYGAAWKLVMLVLLPLTLVNMTVQPVIADLNARQEKARLQKVLRGIATLAGLPAGLVLCTYLFAGAEVLTFIFGHGYEKAYSILVILSIGMFVDVWSGSCALVLVFTGHQRQYMAITLVAGLIACTLIVVAGHYRGVIGVAAAVSIGKLLQNLLTWFMVRRLTGLWTHITLSPTFILAALRRLRH